MNPREGRSSRLWLVSVLAVSALFLLLRSNIFRADPVFEVIERSEYDDVSYDLPMQKLFNDRLLNGEFPLWNPHQSTGNPIVGTLESRLLYPPRLILTLVFGLEQGQRLELIFHVLLCVLGTYALLRSFRIKPPASALGASCVLLSAQFLSNSYSHNVLATHAWMPACMFTLHQVCIRPTYARALWLSVSFAMLVYAGYPQFGYYALHACVIILLIGVLSRPRLLKQMRRLILPISLAIAVFAMLVAPQLVSSAEFFSQGLRGEIGVTKDQVHYLGGRPLWSLVPLMFTGEKGPGDAWRNLAMHGSTFTMTLLVVAGLIWGGAQKRYRSAVTTMVVIAIPFALLSMGNASPFSDWLFDHYPLGSTFRFPFRARAVLLFPAVFGIALSATALVRLASRLPFNPRIQRTASFALVSCVIFASLVPGKYFRPQVFAHVMGYAGTVAQDVATIVPREARYINITGFATEPYKKSATLANRLSISDYEPANTYRSYLLARLLSAELRTQHAGWVWLGNTEVSYRGLGDPDVIRLLKAASVGWVLGDSVTWQTTSPSVRTRIDPGVVHIGSVPDSRLINFLKNQINPALEGLIKHRSSPNLYEVFHIKGSLPRAYISNRIVASANATASATKMSPPFDPLSQTIVEISPEAIPAETDPRDHLQPATFRIDRPETIILETRTHGDSFLVLNDKFFPGWVCQIDGKSAEIFAANVLFRAVKLPAGRHTVEFKYSDSNLTVALIVACMAYLFLLSWLVLRIAPIVIGGAKRIASRPITK